jgi:hypothetical protein
MSAPESWLPISLSSALPVAVMCRIGIRAVAGSDLSRRAISKPEMSGSWMSSSTSCGRSSFIARSASAPFAASITSKPACLSTRLFA